MWKRTIYEHLAIPFEIRALSISYYIYKENQMYKRYVMALIERYLKRKPNPVSCCFQSYRPSWLRVGVFMHGKCVQSKYHSMWNWRPIYIETDLINPIFLNFRLFDIENHITVCPSNYRGRSVTESNIQDYISNIVSKYLQVGLPPWQIYVIPVVRSVPLARADETAAGPSTSAEPTSGNNETEEEEEQQSEQLQQQQHPVSSEHITVCGFNCKTPFLFLYVL